METSESVRGFGWESVGLGLGQASAGLGWESVGLARRNAGLVWGST